MKSLNQLPEIVERQLGGLEATPTLRAKIKLDQVGDVLGGLGKLFGK